MTVDPILHNPIKITVSFTAKTLYFCISLNFVLTVYTHVYSTPQDFTKISLNYSKTLTL